MFYRKYAQLRSNRASIRQGYKKKWPGPLSPSRATRRLRATGVDHLAPRDGHQPALGVVRGVVGPASYGLDERLLHGVLGRREVCAATDEDTDHLRDQGPDEFIHARGSR